MSKLLPPFHKVKYSNLECDLANDRIAVLEMELARRDRMLDTIVATIASRKREAALYNEAEWTGLAVARHIIDDIRAISDEPS